MPKIQGIDSSTARKNYAQNPEFRFFQRQTPGTLTSFADAAYGPDRFKVMSSGANVQVARVSETITGSPSANLACQVRQINAGASQFGLMQFLEGQDVKELRGQTVTFSFWARTDTTEVTSLRAGIIEWTSTEDTITSDLVSVWASTPTLVANASFRNTPTDLTVSSTMTQFTVKVALGTTFNNLALFIWTPNTEAQNDDFYITQIELVQGSAVAPWYQIAKRFGVDLQECQRFYEKSYNLDIIPGTITTAGITSIIDTVGVTNNEFYISTRYKVTKRITPTVVSYSPDTGNTGTIGGSSTDHTASINYNSQSGTASGKAAASGNSNTVNYHFTASAEL